jgi:hypothetical protein
MVVSWKVPFSRRDLESRGQESIWRPKIKLQKPEDDSLVFMFLMFDAMFPRRLSHGGNLIILQRGACKRDTIRQYRADECRLGITWMKYHFHWSQSI